MTEALQRKFVKPNSISNALKCIICQQVFTNATRLYCTHTFCRQCINQWIQSKKDACPICRTIIEKKNIGSDRVAQDIIDQLEVFCPVQDCTWKGLNSLVQLHYQNECRMRDRVLEQKTGKSYKKQKIFNIELLKDEEVMERINANLVKGSLQARLDQARRKNNPMQFNQMMFVQKKNYSKSRQQKDLKKKQNLDFLQDLFG